LIGEIEEDSPEVNPPGNPRNVIQACFNNPHLSLGGISEINCQVKIIFLTLWELGWDPVQQLFLNFAIPKERMKKSPRMASAAADIVAANSGGIYLVCEVKYWNSPYLANSTDQVREYQEALDAPRSCLTNGRRWIIFDKENENPLIDETFSNVDEMLSGIKDWIGPQTIMIPSPYPYSEAFELGIATAKRRQPNLSLWDPEGYSNLNVKQFIYGLDRLSQEESIIIKRDTGTGSIFLKDRKMGKKLIEYDPLTNMIVKTNHDHNRLSIPSDLSRRYHSAIKEIGRPLKDPERILSFLKTMIQELKKANFSS